MNKKDRLQLNIKMQLIRGMIREDFKNGSIPVTTILRWLDELSIYWKEKK